MLHPDNGIFFSAKKIFEISSQAKTGRKLNGILLSERRQSEKTVRFQLNDILEKAKV